MHPIFISVRGHEIHSYTLCLALGLAAFFAYLRWSKGAWPVRPHFWVIFCTVGASAFFGGRFLAMILDGGPGVFSLPVLTVKDEGLSTFGAILGIAIGILFCSRALKISPRSALDVIAPIVAVGHGIARIGCFLAGCCYGKPASSSALWSVVFTDPDSGVPAELRGIPLHPAQLYEALGDFSLGVALYALLLARPRRLRPGMLFAWYVVGYGLIRLTVDALRPVPANRELLLTILVSASALVVADFFKNNRSQNFATSPHEYT